jgi:hypothetical protein
VRWLSSADSPRRRCGPGGLVRRRCGPGGLVRSALELLQLEHVLRAPQQLSVCRMSSRGDCGTRRVNIPAQAVAPDLSRNPTTAR